VFTTFLAATATPQQKPEMSFQDIDLEYAKDLRVTGYTTLVDQPYILHYADYLRSGGIWHLIQAAWIPLLMLFIFLRLLGGTLLVPFRGVRVVKVRNVFISFLTLQQEMASEMFKLVGVSLRKQKHANQRLLRRLIPLSCNLLGRLPFNFTLTSVAVFNLTIAFYIIAGSYSSSSVRYALNLFNPALFESITIRVIKSARAVLEVISVTVRVFSLAIRLFANRFAGHVLLHGLLTAC